MNLDNVKALQIEGHTVASLSVGGVVVWRATPPLVWIDPVKEGTVLTVQQVYSAVKNGDVLDVS